VNRSAYAVLGICFGRASGLRGAITRQSAAGEKYLLTTVIPGRAASFRIRSTVALD
jgi:hypothetical protein